jgi:hypothetical protein
MKNLIVSGATCVAFLELIIKPPSVHLSTLGNRRASEADTAGYSTVSASESTILTQFLSNSVTAGTARSYKVGADAWREYLSTLDSDSHPGEYLERVESQNGKAQRVVLFMAYLYMSEGLRDEQIKRMVTGLTYMLEVRGLDASFMHLAVVSRGRAATSRSSEECRVYEEKRSDRVILPVCLDIVLGVREKYWVEQDWGMKGMDKRGIWLAISLGFDSGLRIGNLTKKDGPHGADHCIRAGQLTFLVRDPNTAEEKRLKGGSTIANFLKRADVTLDMVSAVDMVYVTSKTSRKVKSLIENPKTLSRRTDIESMVLDDLLQWFIHSQVQETDELLTRYSSTGSRKVVIRKDVRKAIKLAVSGVGLPPINFSTKSLRSGFGTHATANGMDATEMKSRGGWVSTSNVPDNHYVRHMHSRGALALSTSGSGVQMHGVDEIARMLPPGSESSN